MSTSSDHIKIDIYSREYHCSDGCCDEWWTEIAVNGKMLTTPSEDPRYPHNERFTSSIDPRVLQAIMEPLLGKPVVVEFHE
jgi:hypothetical protein